ncbi:hypothetical protein [Variovorax sp. GB1P17]|uniref:hypothetical protein n=1 Tax=Variovorax sp. GB1P17 TaxID=3443740 RepID=UPI003F45ECCE
MSILNGLLDELASDDFDGARVQLRGMRRSASEQATTGTRGQKMTTSASTQHTRRCARALCLDRKWRDIVAVEDTVAMGFDLFDIAELHEEYNLEEFANLLMY